MPLFKELNILFIHIPKTGGTSVEKYFFSKIGLYDQWINNRNNDVCKEYLFGKHNNSNERFQHMTIDRIKSYTGNDLSDYKIYSIVRNPYHRLISDLLYLKMININSTPEEVEKNIKVYLESEIYNNHKLQQYKFITNDKVIVRGLRMMRTETLTDCMRANGFIDFDVKINISNEKNIDYMTMYTEKAKQQVLEYYIDDFNIFGYDK